MQHLQHFQTVDAKKEWSRGVIGYLVRWKGIASVGTVKGQIGHAAWWNGSVNLAAGAALLAAWALSVLLLLRYYRIQRVETDNALHSLCHYVRDSIVDLLQHDDPEVFAHAFARYNSDIAIRLASFFRSVTRNETLNCAIRFAEFDADGKECYATYARSEKMAPIRSNRSLPVPADRGLAAALREKDRQGVYVISSIPVAIEAGI
jgi:hypothetical protein